MTFTLQLTQPAAPVISVDEALSILRTHARPLEPARYPIADAAGHILAADVTAPHDWPPFDQSAMDGYALRFEDLADGKPLRITGFAAAGEAFPGMVEAGCAARILTGAPVPAGADTVVIQEHTTMRDHLLQIHTAPECRGANIRPAGAQNRQGDIVLHAGQRLHPGTIGFLAGLGIPTLSVYPRPRIGILVTGRELIPADQPLAPGGIHESNSPALTAALLEQGIVPVICRHVDDDEDLIAEHLRACLSACDIVLTTGGVSVGDYDFVRSAASRCGVETLFYQVRQRPGKPIFAGRAGRTLVLGLPGNPASALTSFYVYGLPVIQGLGGVSAATGLRRIRRPLTADVVKKEGLTFFLRSRLASDGVTALADQASYKMNAFAQADSLIVLDEAKTFFPAGEWVEVMVLPHAERSYLSSDGSRH